MGTSLLNLLPSSVALRGLVGNGRDNDPDDVLAVKRRLNDLGYYDEPDYGFTGYIDRATTDGLRQFQQDRGLKPDGLAGPGGETEQAMREAASARRLDPPKTDFSSDLGLLPAAFARGGDAFARVAPAIARTAPVVARAAPIMAGRAATMLAGAAALPFLPLALIPPGERKTAADRHMAGNPWRDIARRRIEQFDEAAPQGDASTPQDLTAPTLLDSESEDDPDQKPRYGRIVLPDDMPDGTAEAIGDGVVEGVRKGGGRRGKPLTRRANEIVVEECVKSFARRLALNGVVEHTGGGRRGGVEIQEEYFGPAVSSKPGTILGGKFADNSFGIRGPDGTIVQHFVVETASTQKRSGLMTADEERRFKKFGELVGEKFARWVPKLVEYDNDEDKIRRLALKACEDGADAFEWYLKMNPEFASKARPSEPKDKPE